MSRLTTINPAYVHLARQRAILSHTIAVLQERYTSVDAADVQAIMYSDDLPREDAAVPEGDILAYIQQLQHNRFEIERQMRAFDFVHRPTPGLAVGPQLPGVFNPVKQADGSNPQKPQAAQGDQVDRKGRRRR